MEAILARAMKEAEAAEVFTVSSMETVIRFEANRLKQVQTRQETSLALRVIRQGRVGYATAAGAAVDERLVSDALETARFGAQARFQFPGPADLPPVDVFDPAVESVPVEQLTRLGEEMIAAIIAHTPGIVCESVVSRGVGRVNIINSSGGQASYQKSFFSLGVEGTLVNDNDMLFVGDSDSSCHPISETAGVTEQVLRQLDLARERAAVPSRSMPVIFTSHGVASALVMPLMTAFNGKTVLEGASPVGSKLGEAVFDEKLSLSDDATLPYRPGSRPCDDEAVPSQRTPLIEHGVVAAFFYDLQTAAQAGAQSTGNASRGRGGLPSPSPSAFVIAPGPATLDEMVQDMKEGLVVEELMGAEQGNVLGGDFSGNVLLGYRVENGRMTGRVKDTMVSGNIYQVLKNITAVGSETRWIGSFLKTPPIYCPEVSVSTGR